MAIFGGCVCAQYSAYATYFLICKGLYSLILAIHICPPKPTSAEPGSTLKHYKLWSPNKQIYFMNYKMLMMVLFLHNSKTTLITSGLLPFSMAIQGLFFAIPLPNIILGISSPVVLPLALVSTSFDSLSTA